MTKKIGVLLLSVFGFLFVGSTFANPIAPSNYVEFSDVCYRLKNIEIDKYRVIIEYGEREIRKKQTDGSARSNPMLYGEKRKREVYEPKGKECTKCTNSLWGGHSKSKVYLLNKAVDISDITQENIDSIAIYVGNIYDSDCSSYYDEIKTYKISNNGGNYEIVSSNTKDLEKLKKFPLFWLLAVIIETLVLFLIAKIFWGKGKIGGDIGYEKEEISNKRLILWGIVPTTITLPLLWFILPLILGDGIRYTIIGELLVTIIEAVIIKYGLKISWGKAILASIVCNMASYGAGLLILQ